MELDYRGFCDWVAADYEDGSLGNHTITLPNIFYSGRVF